MPRYLYHLTPRGWTDTKAPEVLETWEVEVTTGEHGRLTRWYCIWTAESLPPQKRYLIRSRFGLPEAPRFAAAVGPST